MEKSTRHHYLPVFFLREFCNEKGLLYVYDKKRDIILPRAKGSKSVFFEWNRNTSTLCNEEYDWLEGLYKKLDSDFAVSYRSICERQDQCSTEAEHINLALDIILFVNFIRWRVPARDSIVSSIYDRYKLNDLSLKLIDRFGNLITDPEVQEILLSFDFFRKSQAAAIIFEPWYNFDHIKHVSENMQLRSGSYATLICDNPYIERQVSDNVHQLTEFFFPLAKNKFAFYVDDFNNVDLNGTFSLLFELAKFEVAQKYVACTERNTLEIYLDAYMSHRDKGVSFVKELFHFVSKRTGI